MTTKELLLNQTTTDIIKLRESDDGFDDASIDQIRRAAGLKFDEGTIITDGLKTIGVVADPRSIDFLTNLLCGRVVKGWQVIEYQEADAPGAAPFDHDLG
jgi:hypothetical protein